MSTKNKQRLSKRPQHIRKNISGSKQQSKAIRSSRLQRSGANQITSANAFTGLLNKELKIKSSFVCGAETNSGNNLVDILPKLYNCLNQVPGFKDDKVWISQPSISELADYLIAKVKEHCPVGYEWAVLEENYSSDLIIQFEKSHPDLEDFVAIPLQWLHKLKDKNFALYQLTVCLIYKVARACEMNLFETKWDSYATEDETAFVANEGIEGECIIRALDLTHYKANGTIQKHRTEMRELSNQISVEQLSKKISDLKATSTLQRNLKKWLKIGLNVLKNPAPLSRFTPSFDESVYNDGDPLTIDDGINFCWSFYDTISEESEQWRNDIYNNCGMIYPAEVIRYNENKCIDKISIENLKKLIAFMKEGRSVYYKHFDKQLKNYYDKRRSNLSI